MDLKQDFKVCSSLLLVSLLYSVSVLMPKFNSALMWVEQKGDKYLKRIVIIFF